MRTSRRSSSPADPQALSVGRHQLRLHTHRVLRATHSPQEAHPPGSGGKRAALITCHASTSLGLLLLLPTDGTGGIGWYVSSTVVAGIGYGISFSLVADTAVSAVRPARAGAVAAIAETSNEIGNTLGIALFGSLAALLFRLQGPDVAGTLTDPGSPTSLPRCSATRRRPS
jgi:hypothetical protein